MARQRQSRLAIRRICGGSDKGIRIMLMSGAIVWLPKSKTNIQVEDNGQQVAVVPGWLKDKITQEILSRKS